MRIKSFLLSIGLLATTAMYGANGQPQVIVPRQGSDVLMLNAMSDNGMYAASVTMGDQSVDNPQPAGGVLYNIATGATTTIPAPEGWGAIADVADDGTCVGQSGGKPATFDPSTGQWTTYAVPAPWNCGQFMAVTPDARYAVGIFRDNSDDFNATPMMYDLASGQRRELSNLPVVDLNGDPAMQNVAYAVSPDGRYVIGHVSESFMMPLAMFAYVYDTQDDTWMPIGYTYNASTQQYTCTYPNLHFIDTRYASCDGQWVCGTAYMVEGNGEMSGGTEYYAPYRYDIASNTLEVYTTDADQNIQGDKITNDGVLLGCTPAGYLYPTAVVRYGQFFISLDQIMDQAYGLNLKSLCPGLVASGSFQCLSADGMTAVMRTYDDCYILRMPEPFVDAAARVNLLANYEANIPEGSAVTSLGEVKITFDRAIGAMNLPSQVKLCKADGTVVRSASAFAVSSTNDHVLVVTFRTTTLEAGQQYTIDIPADMVWLRDDPAIKAYAIQLHYQGRGDGPVALLSVTPADGSSLASLSPASSPIHLRFDANVAVSDSGEAWLYNDDDDTVITPLYATAQANTVELYPLAEYNLYKGSHYRVEVSQGAITDLSGAGGCDAITLHYDGVYVRELSSDDIYIFNADCDNYDNFMFWQTEFNEPSAVPAAWGFTAETPWLLIRDNEESTDQALAAHSMFAPAGTSDDWLVTPQLYIPDANSYLAFDAQRYRASKADVLKVYIYATDAVYNYFSDELCDEFRQNGVLVFDEVIPAGATDEGLDNEWTRYTCDLAPYAGQNIYIAFVNNNTDQSAIFIDDVQVVRNMDFLLTNSTPTAVVNAGEVTVGGILSVVSEITTFEGIELTLRDDTGVVDNITDASATLAMGDTYNFTFAKPLSLTPGIETRYSIDVKSGDSETSYTFTVKDLLFEPHKRVVLEEYSGSTCGNCPLGVRAIEELEATYPDNFIPVLLRTYGSDMYSTGITGYSAFLGCESVGAPSGRIDRGPVVMPSVSTPDGYKFVGQGIMQSDGTECYLWADAVRQALATPAEADIDFDASYDGGVVTAECTVRFALDTDARSLGLFAVVTEDDLYTIQLNYMNTINDPALGEWGANGMYNTSTVTTWRIDDVARFVVSGTSYNGTPMSESSFVAGEPYAMTLTATVPDGRLVNADNCSIVVMLIDNATGRVINANRARFGTSGITDATVDADLPAEYYTLQGIRVAHPQPGAVYIRIRGTHADKVRVTSDK